MIIKPNHIYEIKDQKHLEDFVRCAKKQGLYMSEGEPPTFLLGVDHVYAVRVDWNCDLTYSAKEIYGTYRTQEYANYKWKTWKIAK